MYTALQLIKDQLKSSIDLFENTAADILIEHIHKDPGGKAFPIGASYAHLVFSEDMIVQGMLQGKAPLSQTSFKDKTGADSAMPAMDESWDSANQNWSKSVKIDLPQMREYAKAVHVATTEYVNSLKDEDLEKEIDLGNWGKQKLSQILTGFIIGHTYSLAGELSALKGIQGAKGYPF
ncbi:MAG: DinB family protein [bacterium]|nr:DinB family protein [bacterium]